MEHWILGMKGGVRQPAPDPGGPPEKVLADPRAALVVARQLGRGPGFGT